VILFYYIYLCFFFLFQDHNVQNKKEAIQFKGVRLMVFNVTFQQYFSYIVAVSFIVGGNWSTWRESLTSHKSLTNFITICCIEYTSPWTGFELTTLVVIGTDCIGSCNKYHTITTTTTTASTIQFKVKEELCIYTRQIDSLIVV
jgi:hypothetical protein